MNECGCVSRKLHLQKLAMGQIGPMGHNLQTPTMSLLVPQLKDLPLSFPSKNLLEITSSPSERREKTVFSVNEALRVSPQILGKMLMWAVLRLSETLAPQPPAVLTLPAAGCQAPVDTLRQRPVHQKAGAEERGHSTLPNQLL